MKYGITVVPHELQRAQSSEYDYFELPGRVVSRLDQEEFLMLRRRVASGGIPCLGLNAYCPQQIVIAGAGFNLPSAEAYARHLAIRAHELGVKVVGIGSPNSRRIPQGFSASEAWRQAVLFFRATARIFAKYDICVCVEALGDCYCNFINTIEEAYRMTWDVGEDNFGIVLDFYNMEHSGEADISCRPYASQIRHAHISDDKGSPMQRSYLKKEKADVHRARIKALRDSGYDGKITLEIDVPFDEQSAANSLEILKII